MKLPAKYNYSFHDKILVIEDEGLIEKNCESVTNDIENVLKEISTGKKIDLNFYKIIYSDTFGLWSEVLFENNEISFEAIYDTEKEKRFVSDKNVALKMIEKKYCFIKSSEFIKW
jgi:hypothetical protein